MVSQTCIRCGSGLALLTDNDSRLLCRLCHPRQIFRRTILSAAALFLVGAVAAPVLHRRIQLVGLPDIGAPFDIQEFGTVELEDGENAALYYQAAIPPEQRDYIGVDDTEPAVDELDAVLDLGWSHATPEVKEWLKSNRSSLDLMSGNSCGP